MMLISLLISNSTKTQRSDVEYFCITLCGLRPSDSVHRIFDTIIRESPRVFVDRTRNWCLGQKVPCWKESTYSKGLRSFFDALSGVHDLADHGLEPAKLSSLMSELDLLKKNVENDRQRARRAVVVTRAPLVVHAGATNVTTFASGGEDGDVDGEESEIKADDERELVDMSEWNKDEEQIPAPTDVPHSSSTTALLKLVRRLMREKRAYQDQVRDLTEALEALSG